MYICFPEGLINWFVAKLQYWCSLITLSPSDFFFFFSWMLFSACCWKLLTIYLVYDPTVTFPAKSLESQEYLGDIVIFNTMFRVHYHSANTTLLWGNPLHLLSSPLSSTLRTLVCFCVTCFFPNHLWNLFMLFKALVAVDSPKRE